MRCWRSISVGILISYGAALCCDEPLDMTNRRLMSLISFDQEKLRERGRGVVVAIIDSGVDQQRAEIKDAIIPGWNFIDDSPTMLDYDGHGTAVAGVVLALAPEAKILPLVVAKRGAASSTYVKRAVIEAFHRGASIINLSLSIDEGVFRQVLLEVGEDRFNESLLIVAAGNSGERLSGLQKLWHNVIVVGAATLDEPMRLARYSAFGEGVDIAAPAGAPGDGLATIDAFNEGSRLFNGTSGAVPIVSAAAALLKERSMTATGIELKQTILAKSCEVSGILVSHSRVINFGRLFDYEHRCP